MRGAFLLVAACCLIPGCGDSERFDPSPERAKTEDEAGEVLKRRIADSSLSWQERLVAGGELLQGEDGVAFLATRYRSGDRAVVHALLDSLAATDRARAARLALELLEAGRGEEKLDFEAILLQQGGEAVAPLIRLVSKSRDWQTVVQALDALGKLKAREGVGEMAARLHDPNSWVRMAAAHALGEVGGGRVVPALIEALEDTSDVVVSAALVGLGRTGDVRASAACAARLSHANPRVRGAAVSALGRLGGKDTAVLLEGMLEDPDTGVRYKAGRALGKVREGR